jgi:hypothetical protein
MHNDGGGNEETQIPEHRGESNGSISSNDKTLRSQRNDTGIIREDGSKLSRLLGPNRESDGLRRKYNANCLNIPNSVRDIANREYTQGNSVVSDRQGNNDAYLFKITNKGVQKSDDDVYLDKLQTRGVKNLSSTYET